MLSTSPRLIWAPASDFSGPALLRVAGSQVGRSVNMFNSSTALRWFNNVIHASTCYLLINGIDIQVLFVWDFHFHETTLVHIDKIFQFSRQTTEFMDHNDGESLSRRMAIRTRFHAPEIRLLWPGPESTPRWWPEAHFPGWNIRPMTDTVWIIIIIINCEHLAMARCLLPPGTFWQPNQQRRWWPRLRQRWRGQGD